VARIAATSVQTYLHTLRRRWAAAALAAATVLAVGVPVALRLPNLYRSSASLLVEQLPETLLPSGSVSELDTRLQAIKQDALSRTRLTQLMEQFNLYPELRAKGDLKDVLDRLQKDLKVEITSTSERNGRVSTVAFKVSFVGREPEMVKNVVNRLALFYVEKNDAIRTSGATRTAEFLKQELAAAKTQVEVKEGEAIAFASRNTGALPQQMNSAISKYGQLTQQLQINAAEQLRLMDRRDALQAEIAKASVAGPTDGDAYTKLQQAQKELADLKSRFTDEMPEVKAKLREITALQTLAQDERGGTASSLSVSTLRSQLESVSERLAQLETSNNTIHASIRSYDALIAQAPVRDAEFDKISREAQAARDNYDALQKRYQGAQLIERAQTGSEVEEFRVLDPAIASMIPAAPNRPLLIATVGALALSVAIAVVILLEWFDESFAGLDDLRAFTAVPVLASIPLIRTPRGSADSMKKLAMGAAALMVLALLVTAAWQVAPRAEFITRMVMRSAS
jgi:polysaccharide chain length determinant protein (PEP-CTERM system associated)